MIHCIDMKKHYKMGDQTVRALDGIDIEIGEGELVAILGASGSGKSTMMNILGCLDRPTSGEYWLDGENVAGLNDDDLAHSRNRKIGFVFQNFNLLSRSTAIENVEVPLFYRGDREPEKKARACLEQVNLSGRMEHLPSQLSGGQSQRVAIARALVTEPAIILADEPTGNLDSVTSEEIMTLFLDLHKQGVTLIIVTHEQEVANFCSRQIRLRDGLVVEDRPS
jgi:putative ABC transport system ATP-binding protein